MPITINTNLMALNSQGGLNKANQDLNQVTERLSSGKRQTRWGDDPSGAAIAGGIHAQLKSTQQAMRNTQDAASVIQIAEGGLNEINNLVMRMRELAIQGASDIIGDEERDALAAERDQLSAEVNRIAHSTRFFNSNLLNGEGNDLNFQIGTHNEEHSRVTYSSGEVNVTADELSLDDVDLSDSDAALDSLEAIDEALVKIRAARSRTGSFQTRLNSISNTLSSSEQVLTQRLSNAQDVDVARESTNFVGAQIRQRSALAVLAQANLEPQSLLRLLDFRA